MRYLEQMAPGSEGTWLVLVVAAQAAAVVLTAAAVARFLLRRRAAVRHRVWLGALACVLLGPLIAALAEPAGMALAVLPGPGDHAGPVVVVDDRPAIEPGPPPAFAEVEREPVDPRPERVEPLAAVREDVPLAVPEPGPAPSVDADRAETRVRASEPLLRLPSGRALGGALVLAWLTGLVVGLARLVHGWRKLVILSRALEPIDEDRYRTELDAVRQVLGCKRLPPIDCSPGAPGPVAIGVLRPRVVLPRGLFEALSPAQLRDVLVHECAHALRCDPFVGLLQRITAAFYWPHPLVHYLNAQLARSREEVCDNFVLRSGDACGYARTLLELTERYRPLALDAELGISLSDSRWTLHDRVSGLLDPRRDAMTKPRPWAAGMIVLGLAATCVATGLVRPAARPAAAASPEAAGAGAGAVAAAEAKGSRTARGTVVDEAGRPVPGAVVRTVRSGKTLEPATTAADGSFTLAITGFMLTQERLVASLDGDRLLGLGTHFEPERAGPPDPVRIVLKSSRAVTVHVRDTAGAPVVGASVEAHADEFHTVGTTGADGNVVLRVAEGADLWWVFGLKSGAGFDYFENYQSFPPGTVRPLPAEVTLRLNGARTVRIKAIDMAGRPVPGAEFRGLSIRKPGKLHDANVSGSELVRVRTDDRGVAVVDWLPTNLEQGAQFQTAIGPYSCPGPITFESVGATELEARLLRCTTIRGVVRGSDGRPAPGILVRAEGRGATNHYCRMHARTGIDGSYALDVYAEQSYMIAVLDEQFAARTLTGIVVREGKPREGLDFTLGAGTLIHGQIAMAPDRDTAGLRGITLVQHGDKLPPDLVSNRGEGPEESLPRWAKPDAGGRYQIRVGPGRYTLRGPGVGQTEELVVEAEHQAEIVREFGPGQSVNRRAISGVAIEKAPSGERPIPGALVQITYLGRHGFADIKAVADSEGRFRPTVFSDRALLAYTRNPEGTLAGFTRLEANARDVRVYATPASRISGKVVDRAGKPLQGWRVQCRLDNGTDNPEAGAVFQHAATDASGRYEFRGMVIGARAELSAPHDRAEIRSGVEVHRVEVRGPDPIEVPDLVIPTTEEGAGKPRQAGRPEGEWTINQVVDASTSGPVAPSRAELQAFIREIGRDAVTPELVDQLWIVTRPQFTWGVDLDQVRKRMSVRVFLERVDQASRAVLGKPADTRAILRMAISPAVGFDFERMKWLLRDDQTADAERQPPVPGTVADSASGRPVAGALVYTSDSLARTDAAGAFELRPKKPPREGMVWVEAEGYALAEYPALAPRANPAEARITLVKGAYLAGRVLGPGGAPIAGAVVRAWTKHFDFRVPRPADRPANDSFGVPLEVRTDPGGRFLFRGVPPGLDSRWFEVRHPEYQTLHNGTNLSLKEGELQSLTMRPGCTVAGIVVDEQGRPVPRALVEIRRQGRLGSELSTYTADDGRFRFENASPGLRTVVVQPEQHAAVHLGVVVSEDRPVENQYLVERGGYISGKVLGSDGKPVPRAAVGWARPVDSSDNPVDALELRLMTETAEDGTFRLGPLPPGKFSLTSVIENPRRLGRATTQTDQVDAVIRLEPDERK